MERLFSSGWARWNNANWLVHDLLCSTQSIAYYSKEAEINSMSWCTRSAFSPRFLATQNRTRVSQTKETLWFRIECQLVPVSLQIVCALWIQYLRLDRANMEQNHNWIWKKESDTIRNNRKSTAQKKFHSRQIYQRLLQVNLCFNSSKTRGIPREKVIETESESLRRDTCRRVKDIYLCYHMNWKRQITCDLYTYISSICLNDTQGGNESEKK